MLSRFHTFKEGVNLHYEAEIYEKQLKIRDKIMNTNINTIDIRIILEGGMTNKVIIIYQLARVCSLVPQYF